METTLRRPWNPNKLLKIDNLLGQVITGEAGAHTFVIYGVDDDGAQVPLSGTVTASFLRPDGATLWINGGTVSDGEAHVTLPAHCYEVPGRFALSIFLSSGDDNTVCIYCAVGNVFKAQTDVIIDPGTIMPSIATLLAEIERVAGTIPADYSDLATQVSNNTTAIGNANGRISANESAIGTVRETAQANATHIGTMRNLITPTKTNLVEAINEAYNHDLTEAYDTEISRTSENAVQNKAIAAALDGKMAIPATGGTAGQCLMSDGNGHFVWGTPAEVSVVLGALATKDRVQATYTPRGTVSAPEVTVTATGIYLDRLMDAGSVTAGSAARCTLPGLTSRVEGKNLIFSWTPGSFTANTPTSVSLPTFENHRVSPAITAQATAPVFTGTEETITST